MFWIMTTNETRRQQWDTALGMSTLPVTTPRPMMIRRGAWKRPYYMIDASRLTIVQRMRLTGWVWKAKQVTAVTAAMMVDSGVLIDGRDCEVLEPVHLAPASLLLVPVYAA